MYRFIFVAASMASLALARTDLEGCTSTDVSSPAGASLAYYVPGTGEICAFLDCGGGRAPPKTTVPGCPQYSGTLTYSPSYLPGYAAMETGSSASASESQSESAAEPSMTSSMAMTYSSASASSTASDSPNNNSESASVSSSSASSEETSIITSSASDGSSSTSVAAGAASSGSTTTGRSSSRGSSVTATSDVASQQTGAAMEARVWVAGVAMVGVGAVVAAL